MCRVYLSVYKRICMGACLLSALFLVSCAQQPLNNKVHLSQVKNSFQSSIKAVVDYVTDQKRTFVVVDINNPRAKYVAAWITTRRNVDGSRNVSSDRFYLGSAKQISKTFRLPVSDVGVTETVIIEIYDSSGKLLVKTEPLTNTRKVN